MIAATNRPPRKVAGFTCGWRPMTTAPRDGAVVLLFLPDAYVYAEEGDAPVHMTVGWYGAESEQWMDVHCMNVRPSHWMPLPGEPKECECP